MYSESVSILEDGLYTMQKFGMWAPREQEPNFRRICIFLSLIFIAPLGIVGYFIHCSNNECSYESLVGAFGSLTSAWCGIFMHICCYFYQGAVHSLLKVVEDFGTSPRPKNFHDVNRKCNLVIKFTRYVLIMGGLVVCISLAVAEFWFDNCPDNIVSNCNLVLYVAFPINIHYKPARAIANFVLSVSGIASMIGNITFTYLLSGSCELVVSRIVDLRICISEMQFLSGEKRRYHLRECIQRHQCIIKIWQKLNETGRYFMIISTPFVMCITSFLTCSMLMDASFATLLQIFTYAVPSFVMALSTTQAIEQCDKLSEDVLYSIPWDGDVQFEKDVKFMLLRLKTPLKLYAGLWVFNLESYLMLVRMAYSFATAMLSK